MGKDLSSGLRKAGIDGATKHVLVCIGPDCCSPREGEKVWDFLKSEIKDYRLDIMRTKAVCFRICTKGPWMVVYPEGVWYGQLTVEKARRIVREHLAEGKPVEEWIVRRNPLGSPTEL